MKYGFTANSRSVDEMILAASTYCRRAGIDEGSEEEKAVALKVVTLFQIGVCGENDLFKALIGPPVRLS